MQSVCFDAAIRTPNSVNGYVMTAGGVQEMELRLNIVQPNMKSK